MKFYKNLSLEDALYLNNEGVECVEKWKDILEYEGFYKISNTGRIKSSKRKINTAKGFRIKKELIIKQRVHPTGYLYVNLNKNGKQSTFKTHRLVAIHFILNPENKPEVNHKKGDKLDNRYFMLEWNTALENCHHKNNSDFIYGKTRHRRFKLKSRDVKFIRNYIVENQDISKQTLANIFNIKKCTLDNVINKRCWKHI